MVQEAVTNVVRHSAATSATIRLEGEGAELRVAIRDDGHGFDVDRALERAAGGHHLGLLGIRERVEGLGGAVEIRSAPGRGTDIRVRIPVER